MCMITVQARELGCEQNQDLFTRGESGMFVRDRKESVLIFGGRSCEGGMVQGRGGVFVEHVRS
jgi:hypothetical protein